VADDLASVFAEYWVAGHCIQRRPMGFSIAQTKKSPHAAGFSAQVEFLAGSATS